MSARLFLSRYASFAAAALLLVACSRDITSLDLAPFPNDAGVLVDGFPADVRYEPFAGASLEAISVDASIKYRGNASIRISVPGPGSYAGGAFVSNVPRDLRQYDALTFWARASISGATLNTAGLGNDNTGTSRFMAERSAIPLSTTWQKVVIPIPLAAKLSQEAGMFYFAEGPERESGYDIWIDEVQFETLGTLRNPRPVITAGTVDGEVGSSVSVGGTSVTFDVDGQDVTVAASPGYFTFSSSNPAVATIGDEGAVTVVGAGTAAITAALGETPAAGTVTLVATGPPTEAAPAPTRDAADVISLFSNSYTNRTVDRWSADFDNSDVEDVQIAGNDVKKYTKMGFVGIEFISQQVNASEMTHLHVDIYTNNPSRFLMRLVDFGANGAFGGNDDANGQVILNATTSPAVSGGAWASLDIPLAAFGGLSARAHLAQIILENASPTLYVDNLYFSQQAAPPPPPTPTAPTTAAPAPTRPAGNVISLFSDAYTNVPVNTWRTDWSNGQIDETVTAGGNAVKKYSAVDFVGIEFTGSNSIDATGMTNFSMDLWTPTPTAAPASFRIVIVDAGADNVVGVGGDDKEHVLDLTATTTPAIGTGSWVHLDIPLASLTDLTTRAHLSQIVLAGTLGTFFIDNVHFYNDAPPPTAPVIAAPTPAYAAGDVISLFSDAYTNVPVNTWRTDWSNGQIDETLTAGGNAIKKYFSVDFVGVEFTGANAINATGMTHFSMDLWTPTATALPASWRVVIVDAGADGVVGTGADDKEHVTDLTATTTPALGTGQWVHIELPFSQLTNLTTRAHLSQLVFAGTLGTFFIDNVLLHQ